jgi:hypothetical protein
MQIKYNEIAKENEKIRREIPRVNPKTNQVVYKKSPNLVNKFFPSHPSRTMGDIPIGKALILHTLHSNNRMREWLLLLLGITVVISLSVLGVITAILVAKG